MSITYLKVKIKSLAEEAKIIRKEEQKALRTMRWHLRGTNDREAGDAKYRPYYNLYWNLKEHRHHPVGSESRAALIAYGYLRGLKYSQVEKPKDLNALNFKKYQKVLSATELARYTAMKKELPQEYIDNITNRAYTLICKYGLIKNLPFETFEKWVEGN
jgi:hypothetical protein